ncbi:MAG TPA: hypothetical protein VF306_21925 [Pirellulales bacterium]
MKAKILFALLLIAGAISCFSQDAQAFGRRRHMAGCCEPTCCAPEPTCCMPEPTCCAPEPTCCDPCDPCCGRRHGRLHHFFHHRGHRGCCPPVDCCGMEPACGCGF